MQLQYGKVMSCNSCGSNLLYIKSFSTNYCKNCFDVNTFHSFNLRDDYSKIEPFYNLYTELIGFLKDMIKLNTQFLVWYKIESVSNHKILNHIHNIVDIYYEYEHKILSIDDIHSIFKNINEKPLISFLEPLNKKIEETINKKTLQFTSNEELIKRKQKKVHDMFYEISKLKISSDDINSVISDILIKIKKFKKNKKVISKLSYLYSQKIWYFRNYVHHLQNIYMGIRSCLQKDYMLNTFDKNNISNQDKYFYYAKDENDNMLMGLIVNLYKNESSNEYLQEHIFIGNNIKMDITNKSKIPNLSLQLHKVCSELNPKVKKIYCNPLPSMLNILSKSHDSGTITLNILSKEERTYIDNLKILCFKFIPTVSIEFPFTNYWIF